MRNLFFALAFAFAAGGVVAAQQHHAAVMQSGHRAKIVFSAPKLPSLLVARDSFAPATGAGPQSQLQLQRAMPRVAEAAGPIATGPMTQTVVGILCSAISGDTPVAEFSVGDNNRIDATIGTPINGATIVSITDDRVQLDNGTVLTPVPCASSSLPMPDLAPPTGAGTFGPSGPLATPPSASQQQSNNGIVVIPMPTPHPVASPGVNRAPMYPSQQSLNSSSGSSTMILPIVRPSGG